MNLSLFFKRFALTSFAIALITVAGCGSGGKYYPVYGTVEFNGYDSAAEFGSVEFRSKTDPPVIARGKIEKDGRFRVDASGKTGTIEGLHTVVIIQVVSDSRTGKVSHNHGLEVHKKYGDHRTTDLVVKVDKDNGADMKLIVDEKND